MERRLGHLCSHYYSVTFLYDLSSQFIIRVRVQILYHAVAGHPTCKQSVFYLAPYIYDARYHVHPYHKVPYFVIGMDMVPSIIDVWGYDRESLWTCDRETRLIIYTYTTTIYTQSTRAHLECRFKAQMSDVRARRYTTPPPSGLDIVHETFRPMNVTTIACYSLLWRSSWGWWWCRRKV